MKKKGHLIKSIDPGSIAEELELEAGDRLLTINGNEVEDIFDYEYYVDSESMVMEIEKADGELWELEIENDYEDLGINFENGLMSDYKSCSNKCIFCFIDQMPPGMRETLYFKDDDSRLSFLQGNYVTLTNMKEHDIQRIIDFKLAPINISVHTTNPKLRCEMLHNRFAGRALENIDRLYQADIPMNGQIVLCPEVNDGEELDRTIGDLAKYIPCMQSLSVVPVGLTKYRDGLFPMKPFDRKRAEDALEIIERWQKKIYAEHGIHFVQASDEFYILAERQMPEEERYDGYIQLENGVGMLRLLDTEVTEALEELKKEQKKEQNKKNHHKDQKNRKSHKRQNRQGDSDSQKTVEAVEAEELSIATGKLAYPYLKKQIEKIMKDFPQKKVHIYEIRNDFFGPMITVAGLITGQDLKAQLTGQKLGQRLLLPACMFRSGEEVFLDDVTRTELQNALQVPVNIVKSSGQDLVDAVLGLEEEQDTVYDGYELKEITHE